MIHVRRLFGVLFAAALVTAGCSSDPGPGPSPDGTDKPEVPVVDSKVAPDDLQHCTRHTCRSNADCADFCGEAASCRPRPGSQFWWCILD